MGDPFRDNLGDPSAMVFSTHVGLAEDALARLELIPQRVAAFTSRDNVNQHTMDFYVREWSKGWETVWDQLQQARAIVVGKHRDVSAYDAARTAAGDIYTDVAVGKATHLGNDVTVSWRNANPQTARDAIAALRAAMPEVVVMKQAPIDVDLRSTSGKMLEKLYVALAVALLASVAYFLFRAFKWW